MKNRIIAMLIGWVILFFWSLNSA